MQIDNNLFYVVGNGPSLKANLLDSLPEGRWIGMNAAYKYWDQKGRYPLFYACLDPVVVLQHSEAIKRLFEEGRIRDFFLHEQILADLPELKTDPRVTLRNDFITKEGVLPVSPLSKYKQTTGVLATRFCIERGYRNLCLLGIDCNYVERLDEAKATAGYELVITDSVRRNPNYFFDNYQEKNEKYQVPNPEVHSGNLHLQSFVALRNDIQNNAVPMRIGIGSRESLLSRYGIFPYLDVTTLLGKRRLEAIAVPLTPDEVDLFLKGLEYWINPKLQPSFGRVEGVVLHVFLSCGEQPALRRRIEEAVERLPWLATWFSEFRLTFLNMPTDVDYYIRGTSLNVFCNKSGPNLFWLMVMKACRQYGFSFQMESDCVPVRMGWLDALERAVITAPVGTWVIGANYAGPTITSPANAFHVNGNALYATGNRDFQDFLDGPFIKVLEWMIPSISNNIAYDVAYAQGVSRYGDVLKATGIDLREYMHRFVHSPVILNLSGSVELDPVSSFDTGEALHNNPEAYLGHGRAFLQLLKQQVESLESLFNDLPGAARELRPYSFASEPQTCVWLNKGYGRVEGRDMPGLGQRVSLQWRLDVGGLWGRGDFLIGLKSDEALEPVHCEVKIRRPGKAAKELKTAPNLEGHRVDLRIPADLATDPAMTELVLRVEFALRAETQVAQVTGLHEHFLPIPVAPLPVRLLSPDDTLYSLEANWRAWRDAGQATLSRKFAFVQDGSSSVIVRALSAFPREEFAAGRLQVEIGGKSNLRLLLDHSLADVSTLIIRLGADRDCHLCITLRHRELRHQGDICLKAGQETEYRIDTPLEARVETELFIEEVTSASAGASEIGRLHLASLRLEGAAPGAGDGLPPAEQGFRRCISVNPDAESFFGHFLNYEARLGKALRARGMEHVIAGPDDGEAAIYTAHPELVPVFSVRSNTLYAKVPGGDVPKLAAFEAELDRYLSGLDHTQPSILFMYCGSPEIAEVFARLADKYTACTFAVSLYYLSWVDLTAQDLRTWWKPRLMEMARHPRIRLIVPSPELAETLRADFGVQPEILPHPSTSFHDEEVRGMQAGSADPSAGSVTVVFPGNQRGGKGYELTRDAITALLAADVPGLKLRVRCPPDDSLNKARRKFFASICDRVEILDSYLDEASFRALLQSADVVVLPYTPDRFANRTSGLLVDSLLMAIPCVVIRKTWLERTVNTYGFGIATDQDGKAMARGILDALPRLNALKAAALAARDRYLAANSWEALAGYLVAPPGVAAASAPAAPARIAPQARLQDAPHAEAPARRLLIIGNGPSTRLLAEAGFEQLPDDMDSWGTTAAYRYFENVGWWPTYYALADRKVVFHHRENFARLLDDPKVSTRKFFLSWKVSESPRMELIPHSSTGSFSLKKALELGYRDIYLIGMEGAYVEEILESRSLSAEEIAARGFGVLNLSRAESKLRIIDRTPTFNPNYFFPGYQQAGDVYSLPQAHTHQANWDGVKALVQETGARVINLSRISKIDAFERGEIRDVFPYLPADCWNGLRDPFSEKAQHAKSVYAVMVVGGLVQRSGTVWRCPAGKQGQAVWRAVFSHVGVTEGRTLVAGMRITASRDLHLNITFGREGTTDFEGTGLFSTLKAGKPVTVHLATDFRKRHGKLKLQVSQIDCAADQEIDLTIEHVWLTEAVDSVVARHEADELTARQAGLAFAEGNDSFALAIWLWLTREGKSAARAEDIARAAVRIGMSPDLTNVQRLTGVLGLARVTRPQTAPAVATLPPGDFLDSLAQAVLSARDDSGQAATQLLNACASSLLINPQVAVPRLAEGQPLARALATAQGVLPEGAPLRAHFAQVLTHARKKVAALVT